jgi:alkylation response protein AidB-like acyl-CoA dehydrogenase
MEFFRVALTAEERAFQHDLRGFLGSIVTEEVIRHDRETGENFDEGVHLALGARGYLKEYYQPEAEGGFDALHMRIFELEIGRSRTPWFHSGTTRMVAQALQQFATPELVAAVMPGVLAGDTRLCLGYTEPEGGSDVATCKTRAARDQADGSTWIVNGSKMFTSNAQNAQYVFLITNTDPDAPKHQSLTMFLVPMDSPGIEVQGIRTVDGDRTNITYYSDVRVDDKYRVGEVNGGWVVLRGALNAEHGTIDRDSQGLQKVSAMSEHVTLLAEAVDRISGIVAEPDEGGGRLIDDESVKYRLGRSIARMEAALSTPDMFGRVANAQVMRDVTPDLMDILGSASALAVGTDGAADDGGAEFLFRLASPMGIYGGTLEVFRNMIAQHALGLGRPNYSPPAERPA